MTGNRRPGRRPGITAIVLLALGAVLVVGTTVWAALGAPYGYQTRVTGSDAMKPTYARGDRVFLGGGSVRNVERGEVVLVSLPWVPYGDSLSRVVAVGGDHLSFRPGAPGLTLNGHLLDEPYLMDRGVPATVPFDVTVPEGRIFLMGDNRVNSNDSSYHLAGTREGMVPVSAVRAEALETDAGHVWIGAVMLFSVLPLPAGAGLGIWALVARRRAAKAARPAASPAWPTTP
ncbi:signal peptidase I [Streptomyces sp. NPDC003042]